jgi:hypothetical protein
MGEHFRLAFRLPALTPLCSLSVGVLLRLHTLSF